MVLVTCCFFSCIFTTLLIFEIVTCTKAVLNLYLITCFICWCLSSLYCTAGLPTIFITISVKLLCPCYKVGGPDMLSKPLFGYLATVVGDPYLPPWTLFMSTRSWWLVSAKQPRDIVNN